MPEEYSNALDLDAYETEMDDMKKPDPDYSGAGRGKTLSLIL